VDPKFAENERVYLSYAAGDASDNALQVISARLDGSTLYDVTTLLSVTPLKDTPHHYGGRMVLHPDGSLLITSGDGFDYREQAQSLQSLLGKVLRIHTDGSIPTDNPFTDDPRARGEIFSYGHRNPQGIAIAREGTIWLHEHGPRGGDELNVILPGRNYGWPAVTYGMDYSGAYVSPFTEAVGMQGPITYWTPSIAPAGLTVYHGRAFPGWQGNLFVAALAEKTIRRLVLDGNAVASQELMLGELEQRFRDVREGPDGFLYVLTDSSPGKIYRLQPK
jgi:glucose/arabinose dehydrogenase